MLQESNELLSNTLAGLVYDQCVCVCLLDHTQYSADLCNTSPDPQFSVLCTAGLWVSSSTQKAKTLLSPTFDLKSKCRQIAIYCIIIALNHLPNVFSKDLQMQDISNKNHQK